jgi:hypothetical protein
MEPSFAISTDTCPLCQGWWNRFVGGPEPFKTAQLWPALLEQAAHCKGCAALGRCVGANFLPEDRDKIAIVKMVFKYPYRGRYGNLDEDEHGTWLLVSLNVPGRQDIPVGVACLLGGYCM